MYRNFIWHSPNMHMLDSKVYQMDGPWLGVAGIYMFCHVNSTGYLDIHYIGASCKTPCAHWARSVLTTVRGDFWLRPLFVTLIGRLNHQFFLVISTPVLAPPPSTML